MTDHVNRVQDDVLLNRLSALSDDDFVYRIDQIMQQPEQVSDTAAWGLLGQISRRCASWRIASARARNAMPPAMQASNVINILDRRGPADE